MSVDASWDASAAQYVDLYRYGPSARHVETHLAEDLPAVEADPGRLRQVLLVVARLGLAYLFFSQLFWKLPPSFGCPADFSFTTDSLDENGRLRLQRTTGLCDWIGVENEQTFVHVGSEAYPIRRTLADLEARLDPAHFFRAHRSAIVNLDRVQEIIPWFKGSHKLRLTTGAEVELSRAQARALRKVLDW